MQEIRPKSWNAGIGVVGIRIHGLKNTGGHKYKMGSSMNDSIALNGDFIDEA